MPCLKYVLWGEGSKAERKLPFPIIPMKDSFRRFAAFQEDEADMMLDSSHHHGDFLSPPGGHSPDGRAAANARPTSETLARAADAVDHEATINPVVNGVQQGEVCCTSGTHSPSQEKLAIA